MENQIQIFNNPQFGTIRTAGTAEDPLFCAIDIARALGYARPADAITAHCRGVCVLPTPTAGGVQQMKFIKEPEVYRLIFKSNAPNAEVFNSWLAEEVLPSIRKTGSYSVANLSRKELALMVIQAEEENERLMLENKQQKMLIASKEEALTAANMQMTEMSHEIEQMKPKVSYYDLILNNKSTVLITQIAQDYGKSAKAMNKILSDMRIQHKVNGQWILYANHLGKGYVQSKVIDIQYANGNVGVKYHTEWTQKGRIFLYEQLKKKGILPLIELD